MNPGFRTAQTYKETKMRVNLEYVSAKEQTQKPGIKHDLVLAFKLISPHYQI